MRLRALALLLLSWTALAGAEDYRVFTEAKLSDDSDDQVQRNFAIAYQRALPQLGSDAFWATRIGHRRLSAPAGIESFDYLRLEGRRSLAEDASVALSLDLNHGTDWSPVLGSLITDWRPAKAWRLEASAERGLVDTVTAIRNQTQFDTGALAVDWAITATVTAVAAGAYSSFNDGNDRSTRSARLIWSPVQTQWFNAQLRAKRADSDAVGVGYFNPRRMEEYEALFRLAGSPFGDQWTLSLLAGTGRQRVNADSSSQIYSLDARARGWLSAHYGLEGRAACTNTGSLSASAAQAGYRFCQVSAQFIASW